MESPARETFHGLPAILREEKGIGRINFLGDAPHMKSDCRAR
jgi:hypothetical protein